MTDAQAIFIIVNVAWCIITVGTALQTLTKKQCVSAVFLRGGGILAIVIIGISAFVR